MSPGQAAKDGNTLLAALPPREREALRQHGEQVALEPDDVLGEPGERIRHVYFPASGFIALLAGVDGHDALALALVGSEGLLGAPLVLGIHTSPLRARVLGPGTALRVKAADFVQVLAVAPALDRPLRRYIGARLEQFSLTAACASFHVVEARLACWLLMAHDRAHGDRFNLTHERLARLLGVRRSGVSTAAGVLQRRRLIGYTRGHIAIHDRPGLERAACACYRTAHAMKPVAVTAVLDEAPEPGIAPELPHAPAPSPDLRVTPHRH